VPLDLLLRWLIVLDSSFLKIDGTGDVRDTPKRKRRAATGIDKRANVAGAEDLLVKQRNILEQGQQVHLLLIARADQVVIRLTGDRENRCAVHFRVVQPIEQVYRPGSQRGEAHAEPSGVLRVSTRHERCGFFVPDLQKRDASWLVRSASMMPLMPSPGSPKTTPTPQSIRRSTNTSDVVLDMCRSWRYLRVSKWKNLSAPTDTLDAAMAPPPQKK
jgi:hypothetical protein